MTPKNETNPSSPPIQLLNSNVTSSSQSITSEVSTTTTVAMHLLNSIWDDDKVKNTKTKMVRNEWDVCGVIILSVVSMPLGW